MSLLDSLAGQVFGGAGQSSVVDAIGGLIQQHPGGLGGLVSAFEQGGLGQVVGSWVGTGQNLPITAQQVQDVLGSEPVRAIAARLGISTDEAAGQLAQVLPHVVDKLTPQGALPEAGALGGLFSILQGKA